MELNFADSPTETQATCPVDHDRKTLDAITDAPPIEKLSDGTWRINGFDEVRQILRNDVAGQAGFASEYVTQNTGGMMKNPPILFLKGEEHHKARRETNRFFTPRVTDSEYRDFMDDYATELIEEFKRKKTVDLSDISMDMAVKVASQIVGLTNSRFPGIKGRLIALIDGGNQLINGIPSFLGTIVTNWSMFAFYLSDVSPAIKARRENPKDDVISYLISRNYANHEIMTECIVYGVAGMITTREFISVALWHLLQNPHLAERMRVGEEKERYAILHEILRLEPVVAHLYRRTTEEMTIQSNGEEIVIPANTRLDLNIGTANIDERAIGDESAKMYPMREMQDLRPKVQEYGLSFGDGSHRCPGAFVAIQETDIFIRKILEIDGLKIQQEPDVSYYEIAESYELRNFILTIED